MRPVWLVLTLSALLFGSPEARADMRFDLSAGNAGLRSFYDAVFDLSVGDAGLRSFYAAVGNYYPVPQREVVLVRERYRIPEEEVPMVFFMAERARVPVTTIAELRQRGQMWRDVNRHYGLSPIYYIPVRTGHPHGKAHGHHKHAHWKKWKHHGSRHHDHD